MNPERSPGAILVVAAPDSGRDVLVAALGAAGFKVRCAGTASECIRLIRTLAPALVVMDQELPDGDGVELTRVLKSLSSTRDAPVIALTTAGSRATIHRALLVGCDAVLTKPTDAAALLAQVQKLVPGKGSATTPVPRARE